MISLQRTISLASIILLLASCEYVPESITELLKPKAKKEYLREYYPNGRMHSISEIVDGKKHGVSKTFYEDGPLKRKAHYVAGKYQGEQIAYYKSGKVRSKVTYTNNERHGLAISYYENGRVHIQETYANNKLNGKKQKFYTNGKLMMENTFRDGQPSAHLKEYDKYGRLITKYPEIEVNTQVDYISGLYQVNISFEDEYKPITFYLGNLDSEGFIQKSAEQMLTVEKTVHRVYYVNRGSVIMEKLHIIGRMKTRLGNTRITTKTYNVAFKY